MAAIDIFTNNAAIEKKDLLVELQKKFIQEAWLSDGMANKNLGLNKRQTRILYAMLFFSFIISFVLLIVQFGGGFDLSKYSTAICSFVSGLSTIIFKMNNRKKYSKQVTDHSIRAFKCMQMSRELEIDKQENDNSMELYKKYNEKYKEVTRDRTVIDNDVFEKFKKNCEAAGITVEDLMNDLKRVSNAETKSVDIQLAESEINDERYKLELRRLNQYENV